MGPKSKIQNPKSVERLLLWLLSSAFALLFLNAKGTPDVGVWLRWIEEVRQRGLIGGYAHSRAEYPPLPYLILAGTAKLAELAGLTDRTGIKISLLLALLLTGVVF